MALTSSEIDKLWEGRPRDPEPKTWGFFAGVAIGSGLATVFWFVVILMASAWGA